ncbi:MAG: hypothetical protein COB85_00790 [Bacteroidetes bacterium]|nr:MAG: hypothetical protein COB85_00790 [Bacteroidota bacterium]
MNLTLNQKIALGFLVLILTYGGMGYVSLNNLERSREITNKNLLINQPSIILLNEFKLLVVNSKNFSGTWVTMDMTNNPDKAELKRIHDTKYPDFKLRLVNKVALWTDTLDKSIIASITEEFDNVLLLEQSIMLALPTIESYQDFMVRVETESTLEDIEYLSNNILLNLNKTLLRFKKRTDTQDTEMLASFESIRYSNIFLSAIAIVIGVIVTFYILRVVRLEEQKRAIVAERDAVKEQKDIIEEINVEIMASISYAKRIQTTILPSQVTLNELLGDHFVFYKPRDIVSGDFYWCVNQSDKDIIWIAAADCTGHGVPGAFVSFVCHKALNECVNDHQITDTAAVLDKATELVESAFGAGVPENENEGLAYGASVKDGMDIALCKITLSSKKIQFAGAHNPCYIVRKGELLEYKGDRQPIGAYEYRKPFNNHEINLQANDMIYLASDGFLDQFGGAKNKRYQSKKFKAFLVSISDLKPAEQQKKLEEELAAWQGDEQQIDDVLVMGIRVDW